MNKITLENVFYEKVLSKSGLVPHNMHTKQDYEKYVILANQLGITIPQAILLSLYDEMIEYVIDNSRSMDKIALKLLQMPNFKEGLLRQKTYHDQQSFISYGYLVLEDCREYTNKEALLKTDSDGNLIHSIAIYSDGICKASPSQLAIIDILKSYEGSNISQAKPMAKLIIDYADHLISTPEKQALIADNIPLLIKQNLRTI